jgi:hypothetical protein
VLVDIPSALFVVAARAVLGRTITRVLQSIELMPVIVDVFSRDDEYVASQFAARVSNAVHRRPAGSDLATHRVEGGWS